MNLMFSIFFQGASSYQHSGRLYIGNNGGVYKYLNNKTLRNRNDMFIINFMCMLKYSQLEDNSNRNP